MAAEPPIIIATRGSALALAQAGLVAAECRKFFPRLRFELKIIKTTGDRLQKTSLVEGGLPKGLFTKELEIALLKNKADLAVHSLKDLPTEIPAGLILAATPKRADVRDVLVYRDANYFSQLSTKNHQLADDWSPGQSSLKGFLPHLKLKNFPANTVIATSSTRRKMFLQTARPDLKIVEIRGNVPTRLQKVSEREELDATVLALAGLTRLNFEIKPDGKLIGDAVPDGLFATILELDEMLPCVGQGAIGIEIRAHDERVGKICERLNHFNTFQCVTAERAFLRAMGGGCQSPVAAFAEILGDKISMRAISFQNETTKRADTKRPIREATELGEQLATELK
jgi:hydroxymethylbilane synthase